MSAVVTAFEAINQFLTTKYPILLLVLVAAGFAWLQHSDFAHLDNRVNRIETVDMPEMRQDIKDIRQDIKEIRQDLRDMDIRLTRVEVKVDYLIEEVKEIKSDIKEIKAMIIDLSRNKH
jgi:septal ring factor EnvC (AmiA/AmiB activator)